MRLLRPGLFRRRQLAVDTVRSYTAPRVLDVGCGSGRIGEFALDAGTRHYVGVDFAEEMIELARGRLERFGERAEVILGDFLGTPLEGRFEVILALGLFDYLPEPRRFMERMFELCANGGCLVVSFPAIISNRSITSSSSEDILSPASSAATRVLIRSSRGDCRRSSITPRK